MAYPSHPPLPPAPAAAGPLPSHTNVPPSTAAGATTAAYAAQHLPPRPATSLGQHSRYYSLSNPYLNSGATWPAETSNYHTNGTASAMAFYQQAYNGKWTKDVVESHSL